MEKSIMTARQIGLNLGALGLLVALLGAVYWQHTGERAVPGLMEALQSNDLQAQMLAAQGLKDIGAPAQSAVSLLLELATADGRSSLHAEAAGALPPIDLSAARKVMLAWLPKLQDPDPQVRRDAAAVLAALGPVAKPAVHSLLGIVNDPNTVVRDRVVRALGAIALPSDIVMRGLMQALRDPEWTVRYAAVTQFSYNGTLNPESLAVLRELTQDPNQTVAQLAQSTVASGARPISVSVHLLTLDQLTDRTYPLLQLAKLGPQAVEAVPKLSSLLTSGKPLERYLAACALETIGPAARDAAPALQRSLEDSDPIVREAVAEALQAIENKQGATT
jgi:HEAT repeat protein